VTATAPPPQTTTGRTTRPDLPTGLRRPSAYATTLAAITAAALAGRLAALGALPLWRDEAFTAAVSRRSWGSMLDAVRHDSAPPLSYVLTHLASSVSTSPWVLRLPSALAGAAAVPLGAALARRAGGDRAGLCAAAVVAVMAPFVISARDARMYALGGTLVLAMALTLWRAVEQPTRGRLVAHAAVTAIALLTLYFTALAVLSLLAAAALALRPARRALQRTALATAAGALPLLAWLPAAVPQFQHATQPFWVKRTDFDSVLAIGAELFGAGGFLDSATPHRVVLTSLQIATVAALGLVATVTAALLVLRSDRRERSDAAYLALSGSGALALLVLISLHTPLLNSRYAGALWTPLLPLLGVGLARLRPSALALAPLGIALACTVGIIANTVRPDVPAIAAQLSAQAGPDDQIVLPGPADYLPLLVAADPALTPRIHIVQRDEVAWFWGTAAYPDGAVEPAVPDTGAVIWVVGDEGDRPPPLPQGFQPGTRSCADGVCLTRWSR